MSRLARISILLLFLLPPLAQAGSVARGERDLIAIVNLSLLKKFKLNFQYEENRAIMKIERELGEKYRRIHILKDKHAGHAEFLNTLTRVENDPEVKAIDVIVYLHGQPGAVGFVDTGFYRMERLRDEILALPSPNGSPRKLRTLYSDACYGETHMTDWLKAGFQVAAGSVDVDANMSLDLQKFMVAWRTGKTFRAAIDRANSVWATPLMDRVVRGNSFKKTDGAISFTIDQPVDEAPAFAEETARP